MQTRNSEWKVQYDSLLEQGTKPGRYIGGEPNMIRKELEQVRLRFALAFPDVYEIGMSHNGIRMLYHILNRMDDVYAERVFAPWVDMGGIFRSANLPLLSLETKTPIRDFDLVGFSLQAEQTYTNVLYMLDLAGIPLLADQRGDDHPLVCAGGPCTANPEPLADFIDFFVIGDAEETIVEIIECCREVVENGLKRWETLEALAKIQGVYVPQIHQPPKPWQAETRPGKPVTMVKRRWIDALSPDHISTSPIVPVIDIVQDRVSVEVMRGCTQGCRFCQAGYWYRPTRELDVDDIVRVTAESLRNTGNREIGLLSLSTADYSQIECLTKGMARQFSKDKVSISLPSLRADMFSVSLAENVGEVRKNGFTFAPEAGSVRMRKFINKNISNEELFQAIETAYRQGWTLIKLYFMIGLPTETDADIRELVDLIRQVGKIGKQFKGQKNVNASIGIFVPKSFTPFQWDGYESLSVITERLNYLKSAVRFPFARLKWHDPKEGFIEGVLSRGDRQVGRALLKAYTLGCHFDGWDEMFRFDLWMKAFEEAQIDPHFYNRTIGLQEVLPWDFIDIGVSKKFLLKERERSYRELQTYDCKWGDCRGCGIPGNYADIKLAEDPFAKATETLDFRLRSKMRLSRFRVEGAGCFECNRSSGGEGSGMDSKSPVNSPRRRTRSSRDPPTLYPSLLEGRRCPISFPFECDGFD
ncbi:MAG: TIGR03960 family B12-binding radical SAM protein [Terriglobia bacterium]